MTDIGEAERLALITHTQVDLVLKEAEIAEQMSSELRNRPALRGDVLIIDWATGQAAAYSDNVIPFHRTKLGKK
jgi:hypothetical protein